MNKKKTKIKKKKEKKGKVHKCRISRGNCNRHDAHTYNLPNKKSIDLFEKVM